jgi:hypothetical protein
MKREKSIAFVLLLFLLSFVLSGCDEFDQALVMDILAVWVFDDSSIEGIEAKVVDIAQKAWEQTTKEFISAEEAVQLNGLDVIADIERADELSKEGLTPANEHLMDEALELRPEDWRIRERDAVLWTMNGNSAATMSAEDISDGLLMDQVNNGGDCISLRLQQLRYREQTYQENYKNCEMRAGCNMTEFQAAHTFVQAELKDLEESGQTWFCEQ